jgi:hypothetical protein
MKNKWSLMLFIGVITIAGILTSCNNVPEEESWASFASEVALEINISENQVFDAFEQAFEADTATPGDRLGGRLKTLTDSNIEHIITWYQQHPEGANLGGLYFLKYYGIEIDMLVSGSDAVLDRLAQEVASILGMEQQDIIDAFHRVQRESIDEKHLKELDGFISEGYLTAEQADRYYQWFLLRPDTITPGRMRPTQ